MGVIPEYDRLTLKAPLLELVEPIEESSDTAAGIVTDVLWLELGMLVPPLA